MNLLTGLNDLSQAGTAVFFCTLRKGRAKPLHTTTTFGNMTAGFLRQLSALLLFTGLCLLMLISCRQKNQKPAALPYLKAFDQQIIVWTEKIIQSQSHAFFSALVQQAGFPPPEGEFLVESDSGQAFWSIHTTKIHEGILGIRVPEQAAAWLILQHDTLLSFTLTSVFHDSLPRQISCHLLAEDFDAVVDMKFRYRRQRLRMNFSISLKENRKAFLQAEGQLQIRPGQDQAMIYENFSVSLEAAPFRIRAKSRIPELSFTKPDNALAGLHHVDLKMGKNHRKQTEATVYSARAKNNNLFTLILLEADGNSHYLSEELLVLRRIPHVKLPL